jgi:hypothetical protein
MTNIAEIARQMVASSNWSDFDDRVPRLQRADDDQAGPKLGSGHGTTGHPVANAVQQ